MILLWLGFGKNKFRPVAKNYVKECTWIYGKKWGNHTLINISGCKSLVSPRGLCGGQEIKSELRGMGGRWWM